MKRNIAFCLILIAVDVLSCESQKVGDEAQRESEDIVIVNVGRRNRLGIAREIAIIDSLNPKVIAIDIQFDEAREFYSDSILIESLNRCNNLVMAVMIKNYTGDGGQNYSQLEEVAPEFISNAKIGFANSIFENDEFGTIKRFSVAEKINNKLLYDFAVRTAMSFDSLKTITFIKNNPRVNEVEFLGGEDAFRIFSDNQVLSRKITRENIENKIVLFGFTGLFEGYTGSYSEDKFFTPLNDKKEPYAPDMYGVVYHANIVAQVLNAR